MGRWLVAVVGMIYIGVAADQLRKGNVAMATVFAGYAASNVGFWFSL